MAINLNDIKQKYTLDATEADKNIKNVSKSMFDLGKLSKFTADILKNVAKAAALISGALTGVIYSINKLLTRQGKLAQQSKFWDSYGAGTAKARDSILSFSKKLGIASDDSLDSVQELLNIWKNPARVSQFYKMAADNAAALGQALKSDKGQEIFKNTISKLEELGKKGRMEFFSVREELRKWRGLIPDDVLDNLANKFKFAHMNGLQFTKMIIGVSNANTGMAESVAKTDWATQIAIMSNKAQEFLQKFITALFGTSEEAGSFGAKIGRMFDKLEHALDNEILKNKLSNLGTKLKDFAEKYGQKLLDFLITLPEKLVNAVIWLENMSKWVNENMWLLKAIIPILGTFAVMIGLIKIMEFVVALKALGIALKGVWVGLGPVGLALLAITAIVIGVITYWDELVAGFKSGYEWVKKIFGLSDKVEEASKNKKLQKVSHQTNNAGALAQFGNSDIQDVINKGNAENEAVLSQKRISDINNSSSNTSSITNTKNTVNKQNKLADTLNINITGVETQGNETYLAEKIQDALFEFMVNQGYHV